jgi:short subunit dehydrogenase-like uncharacterized protein
MTHRWMIYGATGYTGRLIAEEAVKRGHKPILAGRNARKLQSMAESLGLDYIAFGIPDSSAAMRGLQRADVDLVLHCAGPFIHTVEQMLKACIHTETHYLDITGEIAVLERVFGYGDKARNRGIALMSGVGFDIVPSDCLAKFVADQLPDATHLDIVISALGSSKERGVSAGTAKSALEMLPNQGYVRRDGKLTPYRWGKGVRKFRFPHGKRSALTVPWGDVSTAYRTTGIPNITDYMTLPPSLIWLMRLAGYPIHLLMKIAPLRKWISRRLDKHFLGPSETARQTNRAHIYARASNPNGDIAEAWLETPEAYQFTASTAVRCVEHILDSDLTGAWTPAGAFGADFVLEFEGVIRRESLTNQPIL